MVAVQETASSHGRGGVTVNTGCCCTGALQLPARQGYMLRPLVAALWAALLLVPVSWTPQSFAAPVGASVQLGSASISQSGLATTITNSPGTVINWQKFNIGANELVKFIQQNANSAVLNRVVGASGSELLGLLQSNGRVFLINGNGILIGAQAQINTAGFVASTLNLTDRDFADGKLNFQKNNGAAGAIVVNQGQIQALPGGLVALLGESVKNSGIISVDGGQVVLAAGQSITLSDMANPTVSFSVTAPANEVVNLGQVIASQGGVQLQGGTVSHSGSISANSASRDAQGRVVLRAIGGAATVAGTINANNTAGKGGSIVITGASVQVDAAARINAVGSQSGGNINVGGGLQGSLLSFNGQTQANAQTTTVAQGAQINASATDNGDGGRIIIWGDTARVGGTLMARGGSASGNGGFIETSGHVLDVTGAAISASAAKGKAGEWLLDPYNLTISTGATAGNTNAAGVFTPTANSSVVNVSAINAVLSAGTSVTLTTAGAAGSPGTQTGTLTQLAGADIVKSGGGNASLALISNGTMTLNGNISSTAGALNATLTSGSDITANGKILTNGGNLTINAMTGNVLVTGTTLDATVGSVGLAASSSTVAGNISINQKSVAGGAAIAGVHITNSNLTASAVNINGNAALNTEYRSVGVLVSSSNNLTTSILSTGAGGINITGLGPNPSDPANAAGGLSAGVAFFATRNPGRASHVGWTLGGYALNLPGDGQSVSLSTKSGSITVNAIGNGGTGFYSAPLVNLASSNNISIYSKGISSQYSAATVLGGNLSLSGNGSIAITGVRADNSAGYNGGGSVGSVNLESINISAPTGTLSVAAKSIVNNVVVDSGLVSLGASKVTVGVLNVSGTGVTADVGANITTAAVNINIPVVPTSGSITLGGSVSAAAGNGIAPSGISSDFLNSMKTPGVALNVTAAGNTELVVSSASPSLANVSLGLTTGGNVSVTGTVAVSGLSVNAGNNATLAGNITSANSVSVSGANVTSSANVSSTAGNVTLGGANVSSSGNVISSTGNVTLAGSTSTTVTGGNVTGSSGTVTIGSSTGDTSLSNVAISGSTTSFIGTTVTTRGVALALPHDITKIPLNSIPTLSSSAIKALTPEKIVLMSAAQIAAFEASQVKVFNETQVNAMSDVQLKALLTAKTYPALASAAIQKLVAKGAMQGVLEGADVGLSTRSTLTGAVTPALPLELNNRVKLPQVTLVRDDKLE